MSRRIAERGNNGESPMRTAGMRAKTGELWDFEIIAINRRRRLRAAWLIAALAVWTALIALWLQ